MEIDNLNTGRRPPPSRGSAVRRRPNRRAWPLERVLFGLAGTVTLLSVALAVLVSSWFLLLTAFVGVNQWLYVLVGACPASIVLRRTCGLRSAIYPDREDSGGFGKQVTAP
jgi:hypothetical protein